MKKIVYLVAMLLLVGVASAKMNYVAVPAEGGGCGGGVVDKPHEPGLVEPKPVVSSGGSPSHGDNWGGFYWYVDTVRRFEGTDCVKLTEHYEKSGKHYFDRTRMRVVCGYSGCEKFGVLDSCPF